MRRAVYAFADMAMRNPFFNAVLPALYRRVFDFPKVLQLGCTAACNLSCVYCYVDTRSGTELTLDQCRDILRQAKQLGVRVVAFTGGEPFCHPSFREILEDAARSGFSIELLTNGTLITRDWLEHLAELNRRVPVSLAVKFSPDRQTYRFHTGHDSFDTVAGVIRRCVERKLGVFTFTVVTRRELEGLDRLLAFCLETGAWPVFQRYIPVRDPVTDSLLGIAAGEYQSALLKLRDFYDGNRQRFGSCRGVVARLRGSICACYRDMIHVSPGGDILPCPLAPPGLSVGNIRDTGLRDAWAAFRRKRGEWLSLSARCRRCSVRQSCGGGCISHKYRSNGGFATDDPMCSCPGIVPSVEGLSGPTRKRETGRGE